MTENNLLNEKAMNFSVRIYHLNKYLLDLKEYSLADQILRAGTSIGANLAEAVHAESKEDLIHKLSISRKEASETKYWLNLFHKLNLIDEKLFASLYNDCDELLRMLYSACRSLKASISKDSKN